MRDRIQKAAAWPTLRACDGRFCWSCRRQWPHVAVRLKAGRPTTLNECRKTIARPSTTRLGKQFPNFLPDRTATVAATCTNPQLLKNAKARVTARMPVQWSWKCLARAAYGGPGDAAEQLKDSRGASASYGPGACARSSTRCDQAAMPQTEWPAQRPGQRSSIRRSRAAVSSTFAGLQT